MSDDQPEVGDDADALPPTSVPAEFTVTLNGWDSDNEAEAKDFAEQIWLWVANFSRFLDLGRLQRVVIATDYAAAVVRVQEEGGMTPSPPTVNEYGEGAAMATHFTRGDEIWSAVVMWTGLARQISDQSSAGHKMALHTLFHELVHVDDLAFFAKTFPGGWRAAVPKDKRVAILQAIVNPCQSEYSAQRRSASFAPDAGLALLDMLRDAMSDVDGQIKTARRAYRLDGDMETFWPIVESRLKFLFQSIGYGIGHADWVASVSDDQPELAAQYAAKLAEFDNLSLNWLIDACREAVQPFYTMTEWTGLEVYDGLLGVVERLLNEYGMFTSAPGGGMHVAMPMLSLADL